MASFAGIDGTVARIDVTDETIDSGILNCPLFDVIALHSNMKKAESCHQGEMRKVRGGEDRRTGGAYRRSYTV